MTRADAITTLRTIAFDGLEPFSAKLFSPKSIKFPGVYDYPKLIFIEHLKYIFRYFFFFEISKNTVAKKITFNDLLTISMRQIVTLLIFISQNIVLLISEIS